MATNLKPGDRVRHKRLGEIAIVLAVHGEWIWTQAHKSVPPVTRRAEDLEIVT